MKYKNKLYKVQVLCSRNVHDISPAIFCLGAVGDALLQAPIQPSCPLASLRFHSPLRPVYSSLFFFALEQDVFSQDEERKVSQSCWIQMEMGTREGVVIGEERKPWCFCSGRPNWASPAITWHCCFLSTGSARNHRATVDCTAFANKRMKPLKDEFQLANLHRFFVV